MARGSGNFEQLTYYPAYDMIVYYTGFFDKQHDIQSVLSGNSPTNFEGTSKSLTRVNEDSDTENPWAWIEDFSTCTNPTLDLTSSALNT